jgi:hypothetical protein
MAFSSKLQTQLLWRLSEAVAFLQLSGSQPLPSEVCITAGSGLVGDRVGNLADGFRRSLTIEPTQLAAFSSGPSWSVSLDSGLMTASFDRALDRTVLHLSRWNVVAQSHRINLAKATLADLETEANILVLHLSLETINYLRYLDASCRFSDFLAGTID